VRDEYFMVGHAKPATGFVVILGPVVLLLVIMNYRERRESALAAAVLLELNRPELRGLFSLRINSRPLWPDTVQIDLWEYSRERVWSVIEALSVKLPPRVRLEVNGITDCRAKSSWKLSLMQTRFLPSDCPL
jgi:hypothetical protein